MNRAFTPKSINTSAADFNLAKPEKKSKSKAKKIVFQKKHLSLAISAILGATCGLVALPAFAGPKKNLTPIRAQPFAVRSSFPLSSRAATQVEQVILQDAK